MHYSVQKAEIISLDKKLRINYMLTIEDTLDSKVKNKMMEMIWHANCNYKKTEVVIPKSEKIDFKTKLDARYKI